MSNRTWKVSLVFAAILATAQQLAPWPEFRWFDTTMPLEEKGETSGGVSVADLDGDGDLDIILAKGRHWQLVDRVLLNDGKGNFTARDLSERADKTYSAPVADLDGDGDLDVVISNDAPDGTVVYLNDGKAKFTRAGTIGDPTWPTRNAALADLNGDGRPDAILAVRHLTLGSFICLNDGKAGFRDCRKVISFPATSIEAADVNGDGKTDLIAAFRGPGQSLVLLNDGNAGFARRLPFGPAQSFTRAVTAGDLNGDGKPDLVAGHDRLGTFVYFNDGRGNFTQGPKIFGLPMPYSFAIADMNRDGKLDIVLGTEEAPGVVFFNDGSGQRYAPIPFGNSAGVMYGVATGDLNGDGEPDIVAARSDAPNALWFGGKRAAQSRPQFEGGEIWMVDADGKNEKQLTSHPASDEEPKFSPDGRWIAFDSDRDGNREIYVMDLEGGNLRRLTNHPAKEDHAAWSPDGKKIAFQYQEDPRVFVTDVFVMDADGSNRRRLTQSSDELRKAPRPDRGEPRTRNGWPSWSPDSRKIAFSSTRDGHREIYVMDADGSNQHRLTTGEADSTDPSWSPDGKRIVFESMRHGNNEIYTMDADGANVARLTYGMATDTRGAWSPDGTRIAFASARAGNLDIYTMGGVYGQRVRRLTTGPSFDVRPAWSPDGKKIVFQRMRMKP